MLKYLQVAFENDIELTGYAQHIQFNLLYKLKHIKQISNSRINVCLIKANLDENYIEIVGEKDTVCNITASIKLDYDSFTKNTSLKVYECLKELFLINEWDISYLEKSIANSKKENYNALIPYFKKKYNKNKSLFSEVFINYQMKYAEFIFVVADKHKEICNLTLFKAKLNPMLFSRYLHKGYWGNDLFIIEDYLSEINFIINPFKPNVSLEFKPKDNSLEELKEYLEDFFYTNPSGYFLVD